uniref:UBX domain protein 1 n=1 Tax=Leptobrachium leishanense TaxID=445787 RepID=A0A8C5WL38_9ANUR
METLIGDHSQAPWYGLHGKVNQMSESSALESLLEMGFTQTRAKKALAATGNQGIESAMDWLVEHEEDPDIEEEAPVETPETAETPEEPESERSAEDMDTGAGRAPLTEEEKEKQTKRMMELIAQKQKEREEREKREQIEQEKQRRKHGQELLAIKQRLQEQEMQKLADDRRKEKLEEMKAKERVREKIARDKAERARRFGGAAPDPVSPPAESPIPASTPSPSSPTQEPPVKKEYDQCRIQIRLLDGSTLSQTFRAREQLAAVRLYVELNWPAGAGEPFNLLTSFPRRVFTEDDMEKPLQELGLVPSAVLIVAKK